METLDYRQLRQEYMEKNYGYKKKEKNQQVEVEEEVEVLEKEEIVTEIKVIRKQEYWEYLVNKFYEEHSKG